MKSAELTRPGLKIIVYIIIISLYSQIAIPTSHAEVKQYSDDWAGDVTISGGRTLLVEEISATWCVSCADIDPYLQQVADSHGSRISIVTYHPTDGEDAFQPEAAKYRIDRMKLVNPDIGSTPTFVVENGIPRIGPESWPDVQKDILKQEINRQESSMMSFSVSKTNDSYTAKIVNTSLLNVSFDTQLTFLLMTHELNMPDGYFNPGENHRDRVVVATASCNIGNNSISGIGFNQSSVTKCSDDFLVEFTHEGKFSIVLIHEPTDTSLVQNPEFSNTLGVVEFAYRDIEVVNSLNLMPTVFFTIMSIGVIWVIIGNYNSANSRK
ncbi:MAG: thioredoxin family protein [Candidatus Thermoplasmatota archaeon]|nr:thioredoxin family protein [Candidatus Thermoplasmatota archaeon]